MKSQKGQSTVELALTFAFLMFLLLAIIDFGRLYTADLTIEHASREAARAASVGRTNNEIQAVVHQSTDGVLDVSRMGININPVNLADRTQGSYVTITITYMGKLISPLVNFASPVTLTKKTEMRME
jgi:Flp pilus assembly protein TadG